MRATVDAAFDDLLAEIRLLEFTRDLQSEREPAIERALQWVQAHQNDDGSWGHGSILDIVLALNATGVWRPSRTEWRTVRDGPGGVERALSWLDHVQANGSWDENIWDTAAVVQAACLLGQKSRPSIARALQWLESRACDRWGLDKGLGPHYASQALLAFALARVSQETIDRCRDTLLAEIRRMDFDKRPSPYLCGQMLEALVASGTNPEDKALVPLVDYLVDYLERAEVTIANFIHMCAAIRGVALASPPGTFETGAMGMVLAKMFHRTRLRPDGSWYRNITMTGWALVSLRSLGRIRKIDAFPHEIYPLLASVRQIVERQLSEQAAIRRRLIVHVAGAASCAVVATALLLANIAQGFTLFGRENALYFVAGNLVMVSAFFANKVRRV